MLLHGIVTALPTSSPRNEREKWSSRIRDRNFNNAWGERSPLELRKGVMPNECWILRSEKSASTDDGPMRRDPQGIPPFSKRGGRSFFSEPAFRALQRASAMGSVVVTMQPLASADDATQTERSRRAEIPPTKSQETDGGDPSVWRVPLTTAVAGLYGIGDAPIETVTHGVRDQRGNG